MALSQLNDYTNATKVIGAEDVLKSTTMTNHSKVTILL